MIFFRYKTETLVLKPLGSKQVSITDRKVLFDLKTIQEMNHDNVNPFKGICLDAGHESIFMAYASRGSLEDVIANLETSMSSDFKVSLATDIARGMAFLHKHQNGLFINTIIV